MTEVPKNPKKNPSVMKYVGLGIAFTAVIVLIDRDMTRSQTVAALEEQVLTLEASGEEDESTSGIRIAPKSHDAIAPTSTLPPADIDGSAPELDPFEDLIKGFDKHAQELSRSLNEACSELYNSELPKTPYAVSILSKIGAKYHVLRDFLPKFEGVSDIDSVMDQICGSREKLTEHFVAHLNELLDSDLNEFELYSLLTHSPTFLTEIKFNTDDHPGLTKRALAKGIRPMQEDILGNYYVNWKLVGDEDGHWDPVPRMLFYKNLVEALMDTDDPETLAYLWEDNLAKYIAEVDHTLRWNAHQANIMGLRAANAPYEVQRDSILGKSPKNRGLTDDICRKRLGVSLADFNAMAAKVKKLVPVDTAQ